MVGRCRVEKWWVCTATKNPGTLSPVFCSSISSPLLLGKAHFFKGVLKMLGLLRFYSFMIWLGISLALVGQLKSCTLVMLGLAAEKSERGIISYSKFTRLLTE